MVISPRSTARALALMVVTLLGLHAFAAVMKYGLHHDYGFGLLPLMWLNLEQSIGTWYAVATWMLGALLFAVIAAQKRALGDRWARHWWGLAGIATYLSIDEQVALHEHGNLIVARFIPQHGPLYWGWVVFGAGAVLAVALVYLRFLRALPPRYQRLFVAAAAALVGGAVGMEMVGGAAYETSQEHTILFPVLVAIEEGLEMAGVGILIYALTSYIGEYLPGLTLGVAPRSGAADLHVVPSAAAPVPAPAYSPIPRPATPPSAPTTEEPGGPRAA